MVRDLQRACVSSGLTPSCGAVAPTMSTFTAPQNVTAGSTQQTTVGTIDVVGGTAPLNLSVVFSSNVAVLPHTFVFITGAGAARTISIRPAGAAVANQFAIVTLVLTDAAGFQTATQAFRVNILGTCTHALRLCSDPAPVQPRLS